MDGNHVAGFGGLRVLVACGLARIGDDWRLKALCGLAGIGTYQYSTETLQKLLPVSGLGEPLHESRSATLTSLNPTPNPFSVPSLARRATSWRETPTRDPCDRPGVAPLADSMRLRN